MAKSNVVELEGRETIADPLTELLRAGAEQLIYQAVEGELTELLSLHSERRGGMARPAWCVTATCQRESY